VARNFRWALAVLVAGILLGSPQADAQSYPTKNMTVMCGFAAGGGGDLICRYVAEKLTPLAGQRAIVENKVGALGAIAAEATAHARPDGYTMLVTAGSSASHAAHNYQFIKPLYDPVRDFILVTTLTRIPFIVVIDPKKLSFTSMKELTAWAKGRKTTTGGSTTTALVASETYRVMSGIEMLQVPYKSAQTSVIDLLGGELDFVFCDPGLAMSHIQSGALRGLAVTSANRSPANPDLPTMAESGFPGYDVSGWWAVFVPAGTPDPIVAQLRKWIDEIVLRNETRQFFAASGIDMFPAGNLDLQKYMLAEIEKWKKHYETAKIQPQ
jgi:tripartite-type tricarboxylate transporter receptor subunit TctC